MLENLDINQLLNDYAIPWGIKIVIAVVIFYVGRIVVSAVVKIVSRLLSLKR